MNNINSLGDFKKFVKSASRIIDKISITSGGALGFSTSFSNDHKLQDYLGIVLYWNSEARQVGICFEKSDEDGLLKLKPNNNGKGYTVNAKSFFATNHIDTSITNSHGRFEYFTRPLTEYGLDSFDNLYIISLEEQKNSQGEKI